MLLITCHKSDTLVRTSGLHVIDEFRCPASGYLIDMMVRRGQGDHGAGRDTGTEIMADRGEARGVEGGGGVAAESGGEGGPGGEGGGLGMTWLK